MAANISHLVSTYGYWIVGLFVLLESAGVPFPGETALVLAAAYAGAGTLSIYWVILFAAVGAVLGDAGGYWLGRKVGRRLLSLFRIKEERLQYIESFFQKHGSKTVFFGRFFSILRTYSALFAGISKMPYGEFAVYNATGGIIWALVFGIIGYFFGRNLSYLESILHQVGRSILIVLLVFIFGVLLWRSLIGKERILHRLFSRLLNLPVIVRFLAQGRSFFLWMRRRLTPNEYFGLHFTIGFLFAAAFIWILAGVTQDVLAHDPLVQIDRNVASTLQSWSTPTATRIFQFLSYLGNPAALALSVFICIILDRGRRAIEIVTWMVSITGGLFLQLILIYLLPRIPNFPNGHAMLSMIVYGLVGYFEVLSSANWNDRVRAICSSIILILIIGFSRLYLQLHYLSDILAGFAAGGLWLTFCIIAIELMRRGEIRWPLFDQIKAQFEHF